MLRIRGLDTDDGFRKQITACRLIAEIEAELDRLTDAGSEVGFYRRSLKSWLKTVVGCPGAWQSKPEPNHQFAGDKMDLLRSLASLIDGSAQRPRRPLEDILPILDQAEELLDSDKELSPAFVAYFRGLIEDARTAIRMHEKNGVAGAYRAVDHVIVAAKAAEGFSKSEESKRRWSDFFRDASANAAGGAAVALAGNVLRQITG